jgi:hypothetical protein
VLAQSPERPATVVELLVHHWHRASSEERAAFGRAVGVNAVWDNAVNPNIT